MAQLEMVDILVVEENHSERATVVRELQSTIHDSSIVAVRDVTEALGFLFGRGAAAELRGDEPPSLIIAGDGEQATLTGAVLESAGYRVSYAHRPRVILPYDDKGMAEGDSETSNSRTVSGSRITEALRRQFTPVEVEADVEPQGAEDQSQVELLGAIRALYHARQLLEIHQMNMEELQLCYNDLQKRHSWTLLKNRCLNAALTSTECDTCANDVDAGKAKKECVEALSDLAEAVNQELNDPLTVILGRIQLLRREGCEPEKTEKTAAIIEEQARNMVESIRKFGRILDSATHAPSDGKSPSPMHFITNILPSLYCRFTERNRTSPSSEY